MAEINIKSAFVEDNKGFVLKIAEPHSKKNDQGGYDTVSRTFFDVKVSQASGINLDQFAKGQRVSIRGNQKTEVREWEGKKLYNLTIWADQITVVGGAPQSQPAQQQPEASTPVDAWATQAPPF